jgi:hypothetical protein
MKPLLIIFLIAALAGLSLSAPSTISTRAGQVSGLIFDHSLHADLECTDCHPDVAASTDVVDHNIPSMDVCADCHDIEDESSCGLCHRNTDDPGVYLREKYIVEFNHQQHLTEDVRCADCHGTKIVLPGHSRCASCHSRELTSGRCSPCHSSEMTLATIHPPQWQQQHSDAAISEPEYCNECHQSDNTCLDCHRGDNVTGWIHDKNYIYTHGLDAGSKRFDCTNCHDQRSFCNDCHERENLLPLLHSTVAWLNDHGRAARRDIENCVSCHDSDDPTCGRSGCHLDADGIRGTDPRYHPSRMTLFESEGPWHRDPGFYCFTCHTDTRSAGLGFCGYCHGDED